MDECEFMVIKCIAEKMVIQNNFFFFSDFFISL